MGVITVRIPDALQAELEAAHIKVPETVRKDLMAMARDLQIRRKMATLEKYQSKASRPVADLVRDARAEH